MQFFFRKISSFLGVSYGGLAFLPPCHLKTGFRKPTRNRVDNNILPSVMLFSLKCMGRNLYSPFANLSVNRQIFFFKKSTFLKKKCFLRLTPYGINFDQLLRNNLDLTQCAITCQKNMLTYCWKSWKSNFEGSFLYDYHALRDFNGG